MRRSVFLVVAAIAFGVPTLATPFGIKVPKPFPKFVTEFAPISHLFSQEKAMPSDIAVHLTHVVPQINFTNTSSSVTFQSIGSLGSDVFLTSMDPVETSPAWLNTTDNKPNAIGFTVAPATIIAVEKPGGILDAYYFYFYSFDEGNPGPGHPPGNHIGDWEHSMMRFVNGAPSILYISAHSGGEAIAFNATIKTNGRPTTYISQGTHANYATPGNHLHGTNNTLSDHTDNGALWDVTLNYRGYWLDNDTTTFTMADGTTAGLLEEFTSGEGVGWLNFKGMWGDEQYPIGQHGQFCDGTNCLFADGPTGPVGKNLGRHLPCEHEANCTILTSLVMGVS
ncbi:Vacuolar protein sorting-associated protein 62 [Steccherinum ochraceum]|uniref:Vacuolar protein sorting-associated protein 62 n=1 Tax=Steccherinum ochraceum TaxID=92696 RepID=A0A4R0R1V2_9APHY|nr:Vacuolar protein sorting-associated protein 62 [Steccherinum ochraceum]